MISRTNSVTNEEEDSDDENSPSRLRLQDILDGNDTPQSPSKSLR